MSHAEADNLKAQGNECFKRSKFSAAIELYTQAILLSPSAALYSNRAMWVLHSPSLILSSKPHKYLTLRWFCCRCHVRRSLVEMRGEWDQVERDCRMSLELDPHGRSSYKALYHLGVAQVRLACPRPSTLGSSSPHTLERNCAELGRRSSAAIR